MSALSAISDTTRRGVARNQTSVRSVDASRWRTTYFLGLAAICLFLVVATFYSRFWILDVFNLRNEGNLASLFSGLLLLLVALHAFDGWAQHRREAPRVARAWLAISAVLVALSFDEIGSLHERVPSVGELSQWWSLLPFGVVLALPIGYALLTLWRSPGGRRTASLVALGFGLFAAVGLLEAIGDRGDFPVPLVRIRAVVEEGTELLAMLVLLWAAMANTRGILSRETRVGFPVFEAIGLCRRAILVLVLLGSPVVAHATTVLPASSFAHGSPPDWPAAVLFFLAGLAALAPFFQAGRSPGAFAWALAALAAFGCASLALDVESPMALPVAAVVCASAVSIWVLDPDVPAALCTPAMLFLVASLAVFWTFQESALVGYWTRPYFALALFYVSSAAYPSPLSLRPNSFSSPTEISK